MLSIILALSLSASPVSVNVPAGCQLRCNTTHHTKKVTKKAVAVVVRPQAPCCQAAPAVNVIVNVQQQQQQAQGQAQLLADRPFLVAGILGAAGTSWCQPQPLFGLLGLRLRIPAIHLGAEAYTEFYWGSGVGVLLYPVQTRAINWQVNLGAYWFQRRPYVLADVPRRLDLTAGTGLEISILPHLALTADLRTRIPNPVALSMLEGQGLSVGNAVSNGLLQTQLMLGLMIHN